MNLVIASVTKKGWNVHSSTFSWATAGGVREWSLHGDDNIEARERRLFQADLFLHIHGAASVPLKKIIPMFLGKEFIVFQRLERRLLWLLGAILQRWRVQ